MRGFAAFLAKEMAEVLRTWRIWVLPGIVIFFALTGPPLAKVTPELMRSLMADQQPGFVIEMPDATYLDAYLQWTKNLSQMVLFAVIIIFGGIVSAEKRSGTATLVLTKPLSRTAFIAAKFLSSAALLAVPVALGALLTWAMTLAVFGDAPFAPLAQATGAWLVFGVMFVALMELLSVCFDSQAGAAGLGFLGYIVLSAVTLWAPAVRYSPAGLVAAPNDIIIGEAGSVLWPVVTTLGLAAAFVVAAVLLFRRREL